MTAPQWTPGPWFTCSGSDCDDPYCTGIYYKHGTVQGPPDHMIGVDYVYAQDGDWSGPDYSPERARANAVLKAAAPELYGALQRLLDNPFPLAAATDEASSSELHYHRLAIDAARAALAKARGES